MFITSHAQQFFSVLTILQYFQPAMVQEFQHAPAFIFGELIVPEILVVSEVTNPQVSQALFTNTPEVPELRVS